MISQPSHRSTPSFYYSKHEELPASRSILNLDGAYDSRQQIRSNLPSIPQLLLQMVHSEDDATSFPTIQNSYPQTLIDQEISQMTESIRALKTRRNEMSPVSRLPPELLCKIFELVQQTGPGGSRFHGLSNLFRWTKITHVSRRWMQIALGDTSLWSNITITGRWPEWEQEVLSRSRESPIAIWVPAGTMELDYWKKINVVEKALSQLQRVTKLTIEGLYPFDLYRILSDPNLPRPSLLHSLKLSTSFRESNESFPSKTFKLFEQMLPNASELTSLSLSGYGVEWNPVFFSNLIRLKIMHIPISFLPSVSQVLSALSSAQNLESLTLYNSLLNSDATHHPVIHLPRLRKLHLSETAAAISKFIPCLTFCDEANICLDCDADALTQSEFYALLCIFDRHGNQKLRHMSLSESPLSQDIYVWEDSEERNAEGPDAIFHYPRPPDITLSLDQMGLSHLADPIVRACRVLPLQHLETLTLVSNITIPAHEWITVFGPLQRLKYMTLGTNAAMPFFHAIVSSTQVIVPYLRHLAIRLNAFDGSPSPIPIMQRALLKRKEQGKTVVNLILFDSSHLKTEDIQGVAEVASRVRQLPWGHSIELDL